jgi:hypothetical protein
VKADLSDAIKTLRQETQTGIGELREDLAGHAERIGETSRSVAHIEGQMHGWKLIGSVGAIVITIVGAIGGFYGVNEFLKDRARMKALIANQETLYQQQQALYQQSTMLLQANLIDKLEAEFDKAATLDGIRDRADIQDAVRKLSDALEKLAPTIADETNRSTFHFVGKALKPYLTDDCAAVLGLLNEVKLVDRSRFIYAYMKGACLLRTNQLKAADDAFATAANLTQARKASLVTSAQAVAKLYQWRASQKNELLDEAIKNLQSVTALDPGFFEGHINLAGAYSERGNFDAVIEEITIIRRLRIGSSDSIVQAIKQDMARPSDKFFERFTKHLGIDVPPANPYWESKVITALGL